MDLNEQFSEGINLRVRNAGATTIIYADTYLNKSSGDRIERECRHQFELGCRTLVIDFKNTELVNSIGISILLDVIDTAARANAKVVFSDVKQSTRQLFDLLGLTQHVTLTQNEDEALSFYSKDS